LVQHPASNVDLRRARAVASDQKFVALYLPYEFKLGALNYFSASMRLFEAMEGLPADDRILGPALLLYRHAVELSLKSVFQRIYFEDGTIEANQELEDSLAKKYGHDLTKSLGDIDRFGFSEKIPRQISAAVHELVDLMSQDHFSSAILRYGCASSNDYEDSFSQAILQSALKQAWVNLYMFVDVVVDIKLNRSLGA
jgi:hypothetical protein